MNEGFFLIGLLTIGFAAGYAARSWVSRRHRRRYYGNYEHYGITEPFYHMGQRVKRLFQVSKGDSEKSAADDTEGTPRL